MASGKKQILKKVNNKDVNIIFLHGFAWGSDIGLPLVNFLPNYNVQLFSLNYQNIKNYQAYLDTNAKKLQTLLSDNYYNILIGWSLGGMLALYYSQQLKHIDYVISLASNLSFIQRNNWNKAIDRKDFNQFKKQILNKETSQAVKYFYHIQNKNNKLQNPRLNLKQAKYLEEEYLILQLECLEYLNLTDLIVKCPITMLFGQDDYLVPSDVIKDIKRLFPKINIDILKGCHNFWIYSLSYLQKLIQEISS